MGLSQGQGCCVARGPQPCGKTLGGSGSSSPLTPTQGPPPPPPLLLQLHTPTPSLPHTVPHSTSHQRPYSHIEFLLNARPVLGLHHRLAVRELPGTGGMCSPRLVRPWEVGETSEGGWHLPGREGTRMYLAERGPSGRWREAPWLGSPPSPALGGVSPRSWTAGRCRKKQKVGTSHPPLGVSLHPSAPASLLPS